MLIYGKTLDDIWRKHFNFWPKWLWIANIALIAVSLLIIFLIWF